MRALAIARDEEEAGAPTPQLSTDYLNRYGEALMLIEMAPMDREIVADLKAWRAVGYREHFETSQLRCRDGALAAYDALPSDRRLAFEELCQAMDRLLATITALLAGLPADQDCGSVVEVASEALRSLIGRATRFINANGRAIAEIDDPTALQGEIDALFIGRN